MRGWCVVVETVLSERRIFLQVSGTNRESDTGGSVEIPHSNWFFHNFDITDHKMTNRFDLKRSKKMQKISHVLNLIMMLQTIIPSMRCQAFEPSRIYACRRIGVTRTFSRSVVATTSLCSEKKDSGGEAPHRVLKKIIRLRGVVDTGYGRGGKKLGFPTANLPSSLFKDALMDVSTGVYFGWALVESSEAKKGRNTVHKAVVNVGYSPTFDGEENKEKIVEAHLIVDEGDIEGDFYDEPMRLALSGFLRPGPYLKVFNLF